MQKDVYKKTQGLAKLLFMAQTESEMVGLLHDIFTQAELSKAHERVKIFACLQDGLSQRETQKKSSAAIATVTHGAQFLRDSALVIRNIITQAQEESWWNKLFWRA
ncbi:MAG: trp operon repressor [Candidatus Peregrinibacteria bacterium]|nr:trp operon repressor [Candidatus Peregrinibacteria bacterium]